MEFEFFTLLLAFTPDTLRSSSMICSLLVVIDQQDPPEAASPQKLGFFWACVCAKPPKHQHHPTAKDQPGSRGKLRSVCFMKFGSSMGRAIFKASFLT